MQETVPGVNLLVPEFVRALGYKLGVSHAELALGGNTSHHSLSARYRHAGAKAVQEYQAYGTRSALDLSSIFTYFLDDPINGDQFRQLVSRTVPGGSATHLQGVRRGWCACGWPQPQRRCRHAVV